MRRAGLLAAMALLLAGCSAESGEAPAPAMIPFEVRATSEHAAGPALAGASVVATIALCDEDVNVITVLFAAVGEDLCTRTRIAGTTDPAGVWRGEFDPAAGILERIVVSADGRLDAEVRLPDPNQTVQVALLFASLERQVHADVPVGVYLDNLASPAFRKLIEVRFHDLAEVHQGYLGRLAELRMTCAWVNDPTHSGSLYPHFSVNGSTGGYSNGLAATEFGPGPHTTVRNEAGGPGGPPLVPPGAREIAVGVTTSLPVVGTASLPADVKVVFVFQ